MVVIAIIMILVSMLLPVLSRAKDQAHRITCLNNEKQLHLAAQMYADDNEDQLPPRRNTPNHWVTRLSPYFGGPANANATSNSSGLYGSALKIIKCPKGTDKYTDHSYLINGFNDYFETTLTPQEYNDYFKPHLWPYGMRLTAVPEPSETVLFGEKTVDSYHVHMDFFQGAGNDLEEIDHSRHYSNGKKTGGSNHAFVDGSVRFLRRGAALNPINLWAIVDEWRQQPIDPP